MAGRAALLSSPLASPAQVLAPRSFESLCIFANGQGYLQLLDQPGSVADDPLFTSSGSATAPVGLGLAVATLGSAAILR